MVASLPFSTACRACGRRLTLRLIPQTGESPDCAWEVLGIYTLWACPHCTRKNSGILPGTIQAIEPGSTTASVLLEPMWIAHDDG